MKQNNLIKTAAVVLLSVCTIFVITYFSVFSAVHAEHDCDSHNCCICRQLHTAGNIIKQLDQARTPMALFLAAVMAGKICQLPVRPASVRTLVSDKVRLDR